MMESWGRTLRYNSEVIQPLWLSGEIADTIKGRKNLLPYGQGRSYGDVCLNDGGISIHTGNLNHVMAFNRETGVIRCEAGITLAEILSVCVPSGWFLPVTPGTKYVSLGGAIANDVHGKNQHGMGTFGCHLKCFQLVRSDGIYFCSPDENLELYQSTIGGLGLTGLITWAEFQLIPIESPYLDIETVVFDDLDDYFRLAEEKNRQCEYSIAWVGWQDKRRNVGIFMAGNHGASMSPDELTKHRVKHPRLSVPIEAPSILTNSVNAMIFNRLYYVLKSLRAGCGRQHYESFFYPLDGLGKWNRFYGRRGFFQLQFVVPKDNKEALRDIMSELRKSGLGCFLSVLKLFGDRPSPGIMSFPLPGYTLTLDIPNRGCATVETLQLMNSMVLEAGGRIYPAKDATMTGPVFRGCFRTEISRFEKYIDPHFTSSFWRRCA